MRVNPILIAAAVIAASLPAAATPPELVPGTVNMFRDWRSANDVGITPGDFLQYGADIVGGSDGVWLAARAATGFISPPQICGPLTVDPNFCAASTRFNPARLDPWQLYFVRGPFTPSTPPAEMATITGPSMVGVGLMPFPTSVTMSGAGLTPTISWSLPGGLSPDGFRVQIFDKKTIVANNTADIIFSKQRSRSVTSFTLPASIGLASSGSYAINFQVIETRGHVAFTGNNAQIFSRSNSWFDFTPLTGELPSDIELPTIELIRLACTTSMSAGWAPIT